jgi:type III secretion protein O
MKYVLEELRRVREFRETSAANDVMVRKNLLDEAALKVDLKAKELADYHAWRPERERELFEEIKNRKVELKSLDDLKLNIAQLREKEAALENELIESERDLDAAKEALDEAKKIFRAATLEKNKIEEHKKVWVSETAKEMERFQDLEMEEFQRTKKFTQDIEEVDDV